jgi:hypothetical protein
MTKREIRWWVPGIAGLIACLIINTTVLLFRAYGFYDDNDPAFIPITMSIAFFPGMPLMFYLEDRRRTKEQQTDRAGESQSTGDTR